MGHIGFFSRREKKLNKQEKRRQALQKKAMTAASKIHNGKVSNTKKAGYSYSRFTRNTLDTPTDTKSRAKQSVLILNQSTLNEISAICQPVAGGAEFQVHYRALVVRIKNDVNEFIISIPTSLYNFTQSVTSGSVHYNLNDIEAESEKVAPLSSANVQQLFAKVPILAQLEAMYAGTGVTVTYQESDSGSMHRHPGRFGFSAIDYGKDPSSPGVIYRESDATDKVHTDSVLYLAEKDTEIYTTETRILDLVSTPEGGIKGTYCEIPTVTYLYNDTESADATVEEDANIFSDLVGTLVTNDAGEIGSEGCTIRKTMGAKDGYELVTEILKQYKASGFVPEYSNVVANRISPRGYSGYNRGTRGTGASLYGYGYDYDDTDSLWGSYSKPTKTNKPHISAKTVANKLNSSKKTNPYNPVLNPIYYKDWEERNKG